jgi:putative ABC transport system permease protein
MDNLSARLGADILAVPYGYEADMQNALLRGEPSTFYFDESFAEKIAGVDGVATASPQLYIATLNADCCAWPIQIIGFDESTDFVVKPWLSKTFGDKLAEGEIVVGSNINAKPGKKLRFFGKNYTVAAKLDKTGMGFDTSIFMDLESARAAAKDEARARQKPVSAKERQISSVAAKIDDGYDVKTVANNILQSYAIEGVDVVASKSIIADVAGSLRGLSVYIYVLSGALWALAIGVLLLVFSVTLNARKREFSIYRVLGAAKSTLVKIVIAEAAATGLLGTLAGMALAAAAFFPFQGYIRSVISLPFLLPPVGTILLIAALSFLISFASAPLAAFCVAAKLGKSEIDLSMREGE